jgi:hypothetical protein
MKLFETLIVYVIVSLAFMIPMSFWTWRSLDFWIDHAKGFNYETPYWPALLLTILGPINFLGNVITEVARLFM